ncbi:MAG: hypothetical protein WCQ53_07620 [bacterium]
MLAFIASLYSSPFENSPFYTTAVSDMDLRQFSVTEDNSLKIPAFFKEKKDKFCVSLNKEQLSYYNSLSEQDKKIFLKLASLGLFNDLSGQKSTTGPYSYIYKKDHAFYVETLTVIPLKYKDALPVMTDFKTYNEWVLRDINIKRDGEKGKYFVEINSLNYFEKNGKKFFDTRIDMRIGFKGNYKLDLNILDSTDAKPVPYFTLKMNEPSKLAKNVEGNFRFIILPGSPYYLTYFLI